MTAGSTHKVPARTAVLAIAVIWLLLWAAGGLADLQTPAWYDANGVGTAPDWHYRVPVTIPAAAGVDHTIRLDVDFDQLLAQAGGSGTFDANSPRVIRGNGALAAIQQFTDTVYGGATDAANNGRGEVRFIAEDNGPAVYYLYFDILENGAKPPWDVNATINGNFEFSTNGQENPPNWTGQQWSNYDAKAIANESGRIVTDTSVSPALSVTTDETARSGQYCYLLGGRDAVEASNRSTSARLTREFDVPAGNPGVLRFRYRVKGWDSASDGSTSWDSLRAFLMVPGPDPNVLGPYADNYAVLPFSPNLQGNPNNQAANGTHSGYGQYNGWDTTTAGIHQNGMTLAPGDEPWFEVVVDLGPYAGQRIRLRIETRNSVLYKSWFHIDDVEWSVLDGILGTAQIFGTNITAPNDTAVTVPSIYNPGDILAVTAQVDARAASVTAGLFDPTGASKAGTITLYNDGTHGDAVAGDAQWTNDGSVAAEGTYQFAATDMPGDDWQVVVQAADGGGVSGDTQVFTLVTPPNIMLIKTARTAYDPVNGAGNAKAIPGAEIQYEITARNNGGPGVDSDSVYITDAIPANTVLLLGDPAAGPVSFSEAGTLASGLGYTFGSRNDPLDDVEFSSDGGSSFNHVPPASGDADPAVTHIRIHPRGMFNGSTNGDIPAFTLTFRVRVQ